MAEVVHYRVIVKHPDWKFIEVDSTHKIGEHAEQRAEEIRKDLPSAEVFVIEYNPYKRNFNEISKNERRAD